VLAKLAVTWWSWSALGPCRIGNRRASAGMTGHDGFGRTAGQRPCTAATSGGGTGWLRVRVSPPSYREPFQALAHQECWASPWMRT
jgi:hypothetical protein